MPAATAGVPRGEEARLRVLVCPHDLIRGGSQINAIDLADRLRQHGHDVRIFAPQGPLTQEIAERGIPYREAPPLKGDSLRPTVLRAFRKQVAEFQPQVIHTFESPPTLAAAFTIPRVGVAQVATVLSMSVPDFIPAHVPVVVGTRDLMRSEQRRRRDVYLMEPPIDIAADAPGDVGAARRALDLPRQAAVVAVVGRLSREHEKARGVAAAIEELAASGHSRPITLLVAGAGDDEAIVAAAVTRAAKLDGSLEVRLLGDVPDPRTVYDAADVVFGMGSSALRGMAHAKPLIVQGLNGYWRLLDENSAPEFFEQGYFGAGPTAGPTFTNIVLGLIANADERVRLGAFGRRLVVERYSLDRATADTEGVYRKTRGRVLARATYTRSLARSLGRYLRFRAALAAPGLAIASRRLRGRDVD